MDSVNTENMNGTNETMNDAAAEETMCGEVNAAVNDGSAAETILHGTDDVQDTVRGEAAAAEPDAADRTTGAVGSAADSVREAQLRAHFDSLQAQAQEMRRLYPGFDLNRELRHPDFFRWTSPAGGLTVKQAYMALHGDDILAAGMQYALEQGRMKTAQSIQASQARPREGGLNPAAGLTLRTDPSAMTKRERMELRTRVLHGEKIVL